MLFGSAMLTMYVSVHSVHVWLYEVKKLQFCTLNVSSNQLDLSFVVVCDKPIPPNNDTIDNDLLYN